MKQEKKKKKWPIWIPCSFTQEAFLQCPVVTQKAGGKKGFPWQALIFKQLPDFCFFFLHIWALITTRLFPPSLCHHRFANRSSCIPNSKIYFQNWLFIYCQMCTSWQTPVEWSNQRRSVAFLLQLIGVLHAISKIGSIKDFTVNLVIFTSRCWWLDKTREF